MTGALALGLSAAPATVHLDPLTLDGKPAFARGGPGGGGPGGGHGRGGDVGKASKGDQHPGRGNAFGHGKQDGALAHARGRYNDALQQEHRGRGQANGNGGGFGRDVGRSAHQFSRAETEALIERGWRGKAKGGDGFRNHGERVRTMVELAKRLGYGAHVGALQANFGTPQENGITALQEQLDEARARDDAEEVARLEAELEAAIANAKPGRGPNDSWATADLDVNGDGVVDGADLEALGADTTGDETAG